ncbi:Flap-structured DNA-binding and RNA-binding protein [Blastocladiella emersonii ATCC 22665]|nr:Flap-structured DNA-binding and RNA-binding protein [Blastocladiella emersonii ATCC 22665]
MSTFRYSNASAMSSPSALGTNAANLAPGSPSARPLSLGSDLAHQAMIGAASAAGAPGSARGGQHDLRPMSLNSDMPAHHALHNGSGGGGSALGISTTSSNGRPSSEVLYHSGGLHHAGHAVKADHQAALDAYYRQIERAESMLDEMRHAQLDAAFKEELRAIEEWFKVLTDVERTTALYSLLQYITPVQVRFFTTILTSMSRRADPQSFLYSPSVSERGGPDHAAGSRPTSSLLDSDLSAPSSAFSVDVLQEQLAAIQAQQRHSMGRVPPAAARGNAAAAGGRYPQDRMSLDAQTDTHAAQWASSISTDMYPPPRTGSALAASAMHHHAASLHHPSAAAVAAAHHAAARQRYSSDDAAAWGAAGGSSAPNSAGLAPPPGFGPAPTPFEDHPSAAALRANSPAPPPHLVQSQPSPALTSNNWRSRPSSPALGPTSAALARAASPMPPTSIGVPAVGGGGIVPGTPRGASLAAPSAAGPGARVRSPAPGASSAVRAGTPTLPPGSPGIHRTPSARPGSAHGHRAHRRNDSYSNAMQIPWSAGSSVPGSPAYPPLSPTHKPPEIVDVDLLKTDIAAWLRSLRLHKYTAVFETMDWRKMVMLSDAELVALGVSAAGARSKFVKVFAQVRGELGMEGGDGEPAVKEGNEEAADHQDA